MSEILDIIKAHPLFKNCSTAFFDKIAASAHLKSYDKGQILFLSGDEAERFYIIKKGWVKLFRETLDGSQAIVDIFTTGHIFAETSIFEDDVYPYSAEVVESCALVSIPLEILKQEIENNSKVAYDMLSSMARYRRQQEQEIEHMSLQNAPQRIGCFLLRLADQNAEGKIKIQLPYDKMLVASRLGMQPETFSRALKKLREQTNIEVNGATVEMENLEQLADYSCAACSSTFPCKDLQGCKS